MIRIFSVKSNIPLCESKIDTRCLTGDEHKKLMEEQQEQGANRKPKKEIKIDIFFDSKDALILLY